MINHKVSAYGGKLVFLIHPLGSHSVQCFNAVFVVKSHNPIYSGYSIMDNTIGFYPMNVGSIPASRTTL